MRTAFRVAYTVVMVCAVYGVSVLSAHFGYPPSSGFWLGAIAFLAWRASESVTA